MVRCIRYRKSISGLTERVLENKAGVSEWYRKAKLGMERCYRNPSLGMPGWCRKARIGVQEEWVVLFSFLFSFPSVLSPGRWRSNQSRTCWRTWSSFRRQAWDRRSSSERRPLLTSPVWPKGPWPGPRCCSTCYCSHASGGCRPGSWQHEREGRY